MFAPPIYLLPFLAILTFMHAQCFCFIWHACKDVCFRDIHPDTIAAGEGVKSRVRFHFPLFKRFMSSRHRSYSRRQWSAPGISVSVLGANWTFTCSNLSLLF